jgi:uncharacterized protein
VRILPAPIIFQWDDGNIHKNLVKHSVTTQEAEEIFVLEPFLISEDAKHSTYKEQRFNGLGQTKKKRKLFVAFTIRDKQVRIISIRDMKRVERRHYEEAA